MKLGSTWRKVVCKKCSAQLGWAEDKIVESNWSGGPLFPISCEACKKEGDENENTANE